MPPDGADASADENDSELLVRSVTDYAMIVVDDRGHVTKWNPGAESIYGYAAAEIIGKDLTALYLPDDIAAGKPRQQLDVALASGRFEDDGWRVRKDGTHFWANVIVTPLRTRAGNLRGFAKITRDLSERRRTHEALFTSEHRFRLLIESVKDYAIFVLDAEGRVSTWNSGARRIKGFEADEIIGKHFSVFYTREDVDAGKCERELAAAAKEGRLEDQGWRVRKDGSTFWADVIITPLREPNGELVGFAKVTRDLTERKQAEEERLRLAQAEEGNRVKDEFLTRERAARRDAEEARNSLATTLKSIGDGVITTDNRGHITMLNPVAELLTGWREDEARGQPLARVFAILNEETRRAVESPVDRVLREGVVVGLANHTVLLKRSGGETPIADSGAPIRDGEGSTRGVVLVFRDAREERQNERNRTFLAEITGILSSSFEYRETLAKVAQVAVPALADFCTVDMVEEGVLFPVQVAAAHADPRKLAMARESARRYPYDPEAPRGVSRVIRTGRAELYPQVPDEVLVESAVDEEHLHLMRGLTLRSVLIVPITDGKRVRGALTLAYSESARHYTDDDLYLFEEVGRRAGVAVENARLYGSMQQAREAAVAASRMKDEFLATVSHELRTPLNAILGWAKMLNSAGFDDAKRPRATETIERNAVAMAQLIEDLLDVSRIISGKLRLDITRVNLMPIVEAAIESVRPAAEAKEIHIQRSLQHAAAPVLGDATRLQQVVWNLLSNAVKFTPKGGSVSVVLQRADSMVEIVVTDTGKGISTEFLPRVFDPFLQADGSISRTAGGLGLGLAITKHLVELHGGTVTADSEGAGRGATFSLRFPVPTSQSLSSSAGRAAELGSTQPFESLPQLESLRILVVDDDPDARHLVQTILEDCGSHVTAVESVEDAMRAFAREVPDVLISDIAMPGENGFDLIRRVRALPSSQGGNVPAAALTAYARAEDRRHVLGAGFMMHVPKPLDPMELVTVIATLARLAPSRS